MAKNTSKATSNVAPIASDESFADIATSTAVPTIGVNGAVNVERFAGLKTTNDAIAALDKLGIGVGDGRVWFTLTQLCWAWGRDTSDNNMPSANPVLAAFARKFRGGDTGRKELSEATVKSWNSAFGNVVACGWHCRTYDTLPILRFVLTNEHVAKLSFNSRAAFMAKVLEKFPKTAPSEADMAAMVETKSQELVDFSKSLLAKLTLKDDSPYVGMIADDEEIAENFRDLFEKVEAFNDLCKSRLPAGKSSGSKTSKLKEMLQRRAA